MPFRCLLCPSGAKTPIKKEKVRAYRLRPSVTWVKLDMLLGNANVNYDPDRHITDKNPPGLDWGHCFSFDPIN